MNILGEILGYKREEIKTLDINYKRDKPICKFLSRFEIDSINVIAEIKYSSPSAGFMGNIDVDEILAVYSRYARAVSVLTDKRMFGGGFLFLKEISKKTKLPILCKDFIIDERQILKAYESGADAVLLIARILSVDELKSLYNLAISLGMDVLVEVFDEKDLKKVRTLKPRILGVNSRNLDTLDVSLERAKRLLNRVDFECIKIAESGIKTKHDIFFLRSDCDGFLVGETLLRSKDVEKKFKELLNED